MVDLEYFDKQNINVYYIIKFIFNINNQEIQSINLDY